MKRYFMVRDEDMPTIKEADVIRNLHYIDLVSHGPAGDRWNLVMLPEEEAPAKASWIKFPSLVDAKTTLAMSDVPHDALADIGLTGDETCLEAAQLLGDIHPLMGI